MISLGNGYSIEADDLNIVLLEGRQNTNEKSENFGKITYAKIGYYPNTESLLKNMIHRKINIEAQSHESLDEPIKSIDSWVSVMHDNVVNIVKDLRK